VPPSPWSWRSKPDGFELSSLRYEGVTRIVRHKLAERGRTDTAGRVFGPHASLLIWILGFQLVWGVFAGGQGPVQIEGPYLGQEMPGRTPTVFAPGVISGVNPVHGTPVFSPDGSEVYWSAVDPNTGKVQILLMKRAGGRWSGPAVAPFSLQYQNDVPFIAPDGRTLFFVSDRPASGAGPGEKQRIWRVRKTPGGWSEPEVVDPSVSSMSLHWQISVASDGTLCFATAGVGDIYCAARLDGGYSHPERLGEAINTEMTECCPFISADGTLLLFARSTPDHDTDLYASFRAQDGSWTSAVDLGTDVNSDGHDLCPMVSPDGKYLFYLSTREGESGVYWVDVEVVERLRPRR
jgi:hypothetical protein